MTAGTPEWGPLTALYDSAGQAPTIVATVADDGLSVGFLPDRLTISLDSGPEVPFAGAVGLSGTLSISVPEELNLLGFLLVVSGHIDKTDGSQALLTCAIGHGTHSIEWPLVSMAGARDPDPSKTTEEQPGEISVFSSDFRVECFTSDFNPAMVGIPPFPPLPPFPVTLSMQARRRAADESVGLTVTDFSVLVVTSS